MDLDDDGQFTTYGREGGRDSSQDVYFVWYGAIQ